MAVWDTAKHLLSAAGQGAGDLRVGVGQLLRSFLGLLRTAGGV